MKGLQDDVNKSLESRQKALEYCTAYHTKRNKLDTDLEGKVDRLNEVKSDAQKLLAEKVTTLKVGGMFPLICVN